MFCVVESDNEENEEEKNKEEDDEEEPVKDKEAGKGNYVKGVMSVGKELLLDIEKIPLLSIQHIIVVSKILTFSVYLNIANSCKSHCRPKKN